MDRPRTIWILFRGPHFGLEEARRVLARQRLTVSRNAYRVTVHLPGDADWVWITLARGAQVRTAAAAMAQGADPAWGWELAGCESAFVVVCDDRNTARPRDVRDAWEEAAAALQAATQGFRYEVRLDGFEPGTGPRITPPAGWSA